MRGVAPFDEVAASFWYATVTRHAAAADTGHGVCGCRVLGVALPDHLLCQMASQQETRCVVRLHVTAQSVLDQRVSTALLLEEAIQ